MKNTVLKNLKKGLGLFEKSINEYNNGNLDSANIYRHKANVILNEMHDALKTVDGQDTLIFGDNRNFGLIYNVFENSVKIFGNDDVRKKFINEFINTIKKDKVLMVEFMVYNALETPKNVSDSVGYVNDVIEEAKKLDKTKLKESNQKLIYVLRKYGLNETVVPNKEKQTLYENIEFVLFNNKKIGNLTDYQVCVKTLAESVEKNNVNIQQKTLEDFYSEKMSEINEKYEKLLTDEEKLFLTEMEKSKKDRKLVFDKNKEILVKSLNEKINSDNENSDEWATILEKIEKKAYNDKTSIVDIAEMIEIKNIL